MRGAGRRLPVSFLLLIACHGPPPPPTGAGATGALETPSADASGAGCGTPTGDADEGSFEQRTFREVLVGALRFPAKRLTWILFRSPGHARLRMLCQNSVHTPPLGLSLDGKENGESVWSVPSIVEYTGLAGPGLAYDLSTASQPSGLPGCEPPHVRLQLRCHEGRVEVLAAGAVLVPGKKGADDRIAPPRWRPSSRERVDSLLCDVLAEDDPGSYRPIRARRELAFVAVSRRSAGIEWADENSDMTAQAGAYRWMPGPQ